MKTKLILDITKSRQAQLNSVITGRQGDKATVTVNVFVVDGGIPVNLTGNTIYYEGLKPNDAYVRDTSGVKMINATQGNFEYTFRPETFGVAGIGKRSYFSIEQGSTVRASTQDFGLVTLADAMTGNTMSGPYISELEELINLAQWLVDDINSRWTSINDQLTQLQNKLNTMDVVKRSGDTMTGNLGMDRKVDNTTIYTQFKTGNVSNYFVGMNAVGKYHLYDDKSKLTPFEYDPASKSFNVFSATNLLKKAGDTMTGDLNFGGTTARQITAAAGTGKVVFGGSGLWIEDSNGGNIPWQYRYSDKQFIVNAETNLVKKTGDTATGHMTFKGNIIHELLADSNKGIQMVVNNSANKWSVGPKMTGTVDWSKEMALDLNTGKLTVAELATKKDGRASLTLTTDATNADTGNPPSVIRRGNTVTVRFKISRNAGSSSSRVTTLPVDMRPIEYIEFNTISDSGSLVKITIGTGGGVDMYTTGQIVAFVATFVVD